ncbi:Myb family transcription factor [Zostera marina]|uniref:Transcription factor MYBS1 n=1 Tax=Zostera marina TaxID=29655 RepID=A0A0K9PWD0_ZOSMR|nr:Myb family transcription factor [Zostera marina]
MREISDTLPASPSRDLSSAVEDFGMEEATNSGSTWTWEQEKAFENALAVYAEESSNRWVCVAADVDGKTEEEVRRHFEILIEDIDGIESGRVPLPSYVSSSEGSAEDIGGNKGKKSSSNATGKKLPRTYQERRKGIAWSEDEHRLFLLGLDKYGKGDWRSISRNFVVSRTPTQVASHAQKYFIRLNSMNKERRRSSIHDITTPAGVDKDGDDVTATAATTEQ